MTNRARQTALMIFTKAPEPGMVKTRLIPALGRRYSAQLYQRMLLSTISKATQAGFTSVQLWVSGNPNHLLFMQIKKRYGISIYQQRGRDLGTRMYNAFNSVLRNNGSAVVIGCDCPSLNKADLVLARQALCDDYAAVLGPATDGGYYLLGLRQLHPKVFNNIDWSTSSVAATTAERIGSLDWRLKELVKHRDIDTSADLMTYFHSRTPDNSFSYSRA